MKDSTLEMIGSAAAGIAHDINNQLNLIVNHLSLRDVDSAMQAVERCSAMTGSLLSYCKGECVTPVSTDPTLFLMKFAAQLDLPTGIQIFLKLAPSMPPIAADPLALARALTNLVSNACDAIEGYGEIAIESAPYTITVSDEGHGIPEEHLQRVFEPFFTTRGEEGTGLGLSIVRELMRRQGGSVSAQSEPGRGASFTLQFRPA